MAQRTGAARTARTLEKDVTERTQGLEVANKQLRQLATHDALTGLPNSLLLDDRICQAIAHAERAGNGFAVCVLDLDRLKTINESLGYRAGDELLKHVARRLVSVVRSVDTVARLGGDKFVMILGQVRSAEDAERIGLKMRRGAASVGTDRAARDPHLGEHRRCLLPKRRHDARDSLRSRRRGDVLCQATRRLQHPVLRIDA